MKGESAMSGYITITMSATCSRHVGVLTVSAFTFVATQILNDTLVQGNQLR